VTVPPRTLVSAAVSRRTALTLGGATASAFTLAACAPSTPAPAAEPPSEPTEVGSLADLPVGGTASAKLGELPILLSRPTEGEVKAFNAICTHQGCVVAPQEGRFGCPCHNSVFDVNTGDPTEGPATEPLAKFKVTLDGDTILVSA
jgi:Rieske Fe-S protein